MARKKSASNAENPYTVTMDELKSMLNCGYASARKIGEASGARVVIGGRVFYIFSRIEKYMEKLADEQAIESEV